ncbi:hypothetical protein [Leisingera aquaemixtae]|uniref:Uncharacterized protein n=1 Tax=Leisingera aquaemixtae TaxID=1396826 RepID=A0A0P1HZ92_9RHOB|nr:hypothetical protein [Leisingera aquaemixtae]CUI01872.1 hypothetical protein PHA8399_04021 [Leisingera aquaemixtae]
MSDPTRPTLASRILRGVFLFVAVPVLVVLLLGIIGWDADFYALRDRWEHMKLALFGDWQAENWCPPGRGSDNCDEAAQFEDALADAGDFTFFRRATIAGTDLTVHTGIRFATARDVVDGHPASQWCYVALPDGAVQQQIDLASKTAGNPPVYTSLASLDATALAGFGVSADALSDIARSHCRFVSPKEES